MAYSCQERPTVPSKNPSDIAEAISPEDDLAEVRALFVRQVEAENDHDLAAIAEILIEEASVRAGQTVFVARIGRFLGRDAVLQRFENNFRGIWKFEPDMAEFYATHLSADAIFVSVPTSVTMGPAGETPRTGRFLVNQVAVRTSRGWRFAAIVPVPMG